MGLKENRFWTVVAETEGDMPHVGDICLVFPTLQQALDHARQLAMEVQGKYYVMKAERAVCSVLADPEEIVLK